MSRVYNSKSQLMSARRSAIMSQIDLDLLPLICLNTCCKGYPGDGSTGITQNVLRLRLPEPKCIQPALASSLHASTAAKRCKASYDSLSLQVFLP